MDSSPVSPSTATPEWPAGRVTQSPRAVAFLDLPGDNDRLLVDHYSRAEDLERVTFGKRDPFLSKVGRGSHVDCERLLLGLHREMRPAKSMTAATACAGDRVDGLNSALDRRLRLKVVHRRGPAGPGLRYHPGDSGEGKHGSCPDDR